MDTNNINQESMVPVIDAQNHVEVPVKQNKSKRLLIILGAVFILLLVGIGAYILTAKNTQRLPQAQQKTVILPASFQISPSPTSFTPTNSQLTIDLF